MYVPGGSFVTTCELIKSDIATSKGLIYSYSIPGKDGLIVS